MDDLLQAERDLRRKSEDAIRAMRQALVETANRFDGKRLQEISRNDPSIPAHWGALDWKQFFDEVPAPARGWGASVEPDMQAQRELRNQIAALKTALSQAELNLEDERAKNSAVVAPPVFVSTEITNVENTATDALENIPSGATPALSAIVLDAKMARKKFPQKIPAALSNALSGGERSGGDLQRVFERYWIVLYLIGRWRLTASMELTEALAQTVGVSGGSSSIQRVITGLENAKVLVTEVLELQSPRTSLKLHRFSAAGESLYQSLFQARPLENDWARLIRLREGARFPEYTVATLLLAMHARKRGWATQVLPEVKGTKSAPDARVMRGAEKLYVEVESDERRNQSALNGGRAALCALTQKSRAQWVSACKLEHLPGMATDIESLLSKFNDLNSDSPFWLENWE